ncbi:hypothetical protein FHS52_000690 [Erythromicrobium ramosum]|uniref:DUF3035 domain-containing protein n=1 Tax=Erythrobacter ramosus TaxID=35811 RepID=A0A6I4UJW8_9SPHN|nr:DUF3035 domain-containing protein [Erythrobacter ramosus]MBB3774747.1 hypothetical protein [Erythrobacter ramosus]MXP37609.1 DUF3035 domain-containing protein [Erythrobacter ramosus]
MRKFAPLILLTGASAMLAACGGGGGVFNRERPDEFAVQRQAPLVVPPDFTLTPPAPGAPRPSEGTASEQALEALFGGPAPRSRVEASVIDRAGAAAPSIRSQVGDTETNTVAKGRVTRDIIAAPEGDGQAATTVIPSA